jgi:hypothetical protein
MRAGATQAIGRRLDHVADAGLLGLPVARDMARAVAVAARTLSLGKDRTWAHHTARATHRASQKPLQIRRRFVGRALQIERRDELAVAIHQIDQRGMVHRVVAVLHRHLLGIDAVA